MDRRIKITREIKKDIEELARQGYGARKIASLLGLKQGTVNMYMTMYHQGVESVGELFNKNAKKAGFTTHAMRQKFNRQMRPGHVEHGYTNTRARRAGYASHTEYRKDLAAQVGKTIYEEQLRRVKSAGFESVHEYRKFRSWLNGMSVGEYDLMRGSERMKNPQNQAFSAYLKDKLAEREMSYAKLSELVGVSDQSIMRYAQGFNLPRPKIVQRIFAVFNDDYRTIDDLLRE